MIIRLCKRQRHIIHTIKSQHIARFAGMVFYPSLQLLEIPMLFLTPVCVGVHHTVRKQQINLLKHELKYDIIKEDYHKYRYASIPLNSLSDETHITFYDDSNSDGLRS